MALSLALQTALTGLIASQKNLSVASQNISNASTEGYTRKIAKQESQSLDGYPAGVRVTGILRKIDEFLLSTNRTYASQVGTTQTISDYFNKLQVYFGSPEGMNNLQGFVDNFFASLKQLSDNPESPAVRGSTLNSAKSLVTEISTLAENLEGIRFEADQDILNSTTELNQYIDELFFLNKAIDQSYISGTSDPDLLDKRDILLKNIASIVNISTYNNESGSVNVYAGNGVPLVDESRHRLTYTPASSVDAFIDDVTLGALKVYSLDVSGNLKGTPTDLISSGTSSEVTTVLSSGKIYGLQQIRDVEITNILEQLDQMVSTLTTEFNKIHNDGAGYPPPTTLTGTVPITSDAQRQWSGSVMIGVVNKDGTAIPTGYTNEGGGVRPLTLQLGSLDLGDGDGVLDMETIKDEINAAFGPNQKKIQIQNLNDVRLVSMVDNTPAGTSFTFDLDLENISDQAADVTVLSVTPSAGVVNSFTATAYQIEPGVKTRTGTDNQISVNFGAAGTHTLDVQIQVVDEDGNTSTATIRYTVNTAVTDVRNNRYIGTVQAGATGQVMEKNPTNVQSYATAQIVDANGNSASPGEIGYLKITTSNANYGLAINELDSVDNGLPTGTPVIDATNYGFSMFFGLNDFFVRNDTDSDGIIDVKNSAVNMQIRSDIASNASLISTGELTLSTQPADTTVYPYYSYQLGAGGNQVAERLADLANQGLDFPAAGGLTVGAKPIADYVSDIVGYMSNSTNLAKSNLDSDQFLQKSFQDKFNAASGVNMDEELANTIMFQNAYTASAKIITTVSQLFEALINAV